MKIAALSVAYNEEALLPSYLRHYGRFCDVIVLWDNGSTDRTAEIARAHPKVDLRRFETEGHDTLTGLRVQEAGKREFAGYDWLLLPDVDEFISTRKAGGERAALEASSGADVLVTDGYCVVQRPGEPRLRFDRPLAAQRRFAHWSKNYSKPVVIRPSADVRFVPGRHAAVYGAGVRVAGYGAFVLVHVDMADFELFRYRKNRRPLSTDNIRHGYSHGHFMRNRNDHESSWATALELPALPIPADRWDE